MPPTSRVFARGATVLALCVGLLAVVVPPAPGATAAIATHSPVVSQQEALADDSSGTQPAAESTANSTDSSGPRISPEDSEQATQDKARTKVIFAIVLIGLLALVIYGRKRRNKRKIRMRR